MTTDLHEVPLLNEPSLMLTILRAAARAPVNREACVESLIVSFARVREVLPGPREGLAKRIDQPFFKLVRAGLLASVGVGLFALTERGGEALQRYPAGLDETVLTQYPEYRAYLRASEFHAAVDGRATFEAYGRGFLDWHDDRVATDNPFDSDSADHLAWENGWSEARDVSRSTREES